MERLGTTTVSEIIVKRPHRAQEIIVITSEVAPMKTIAVPRASVASLQPDGWTKITNLSGTALQNVQSKKDAKAKTAAPLTITARPNAVAVIYAAVGRMER